jgi:hypothetical protein
MDQNQENEKSLNWWAYALAWGSFISGVLAALVAAVKVTPPDKNEYYK